MSLVVKRPIHKEIKSKLKQLCSPVMVLIRWIRSKCRMRSSQEEEEGQVVEKEEDNPMFINNKTVI